MSRDFDEINPDHIEGEPEGKLLKWLSVLILLLAVGGFFALAWYAYHTGTNQTETVQAEENLDLVKADPEPAKEAPQDPGGQQFPHQDKAVFNAISGDDKQPVERILPASEEPVERADKPETETWMNDRLNKTQPPATPAQPENKPEAVAATEEPSNVPVTQFDPASVKSAESKPAETTEAPAEKPAEKPTEKPADVMARVPEISALPPKMAAPVVAEKAKEPAAAPKKVEKPVAEKSVAEKAPAVKPVQESAAETKKPNGVRAQLGAFKSQEEAEGHWNSVRAKLTSKLDGKEHRVLRVDLGPKGIFYRLHVLPFSSAGNAQSFCASIAPQACFVVGK